MKHLLLICLSLSLIVSCNLSDDPAEERANRAEKARGDIVIGAVAPWSSGNMWNGVELAINEINDHGGIMGRKFRVIKEDDESSLSKGQNIAHKFSKNLDMVAVVGHYNSYITLPCSIIYQYYGLLMLTPYSSVPKLTQQGFKFVFRNTISDESYGEKLAGFSHQQGYRNVLIYHSKNNYGTGFANEFEKYGEAIGLNIVDRLSYDSFAAEREFGKDLKYWKDNFRFDTIFLAGTLPQAALFIKEARKIGIKVPIVTGAGLDSKRLLKIAGKAANGTFVGTLFQPGNTTPQTKTFVKKYFQKYHMLPNNAAAQGYDTIMVLAYAMKNARSTVPDQVAKALRNLDKWRGPIAKSSFDKNGDIQGGTISLKLVKNGTFKFFK